MKKNLGVSLGALCTALMITAGCSNNAEKENEELKKHITELEETVSELKTQSEITTKTEEDEVKDNSSEKLEKLLGSWVFEGDFSGGNYIEITEDNKLLKVNWLNSDYAEEYGEHYSEYEIVSIDSYKWVLKEISINGEPSDSDEEAIIEMSEEKIISFPGMPADSSGLKIDTSSSSYDEFEGMNGDWYESSIDTTFEFSLQDDYVIMTGTDKGDDLLVDIYMKIIGTTVNNSLVLVQERAVAESIGKEEIFDQSDNVLILEVDGKNLDLVNGDAVISFTRN